MLLLCAGCSRNAETAVPASTAADRAIPVQVSFRDEPTSRPVEVGTAAAQRKVAVEDTLEPIPIDDANVPNSTHSAGSPRTRK